MKFDFFVASAEKLNPLNRVTRIIKKHPETKLDRNGSPILEFKSIEEMCEFLAKQDKMISIGAFKTKEGETHAYLYEYDRPMKNYNGGRNNG